jgi:rubrerythrin
VATGTEGGRGSTPAAASAEVLEGLNDLLQLDHDAVGAYEIAIEQLENRDHALQIKGFRSDHERHIRELNDLILRLGGSPVNEPHATAPLKQALQKVAAAAGDRALLMAWRANEFQVMTKYDGYARQGRAWPPEAKRLVDEFALDEERHYQWVAGVLGDSAPEVELANRAREGLARAQVASEEAQDMLGRAARTARLKAADGLQMAADRLERLAQEQETAEGTRAQAAAGAQRLARGLDSTATLLREGGDGEAGLRLEEVRAGIEEEIRVNTVRSLVATFALGFVLGRILR